MRKRGPVVVYGASLLALAAAVLLRLALDPILGDDLALVTLYGPVALAVWLGGHRPAIAVATLGYLACAYLFIEPRGSVGLTEPRTVIGLLAFAFTSSILIAIGEVARRSQRFADGDRESLRTTLASIGDAVVATDPEGRVRMLNPVAESLTGWTEGEARDRPLAEVFRIVNEATRLPVENPVEKVLELGRVQGLANHTILVSRDGTERPIDDSAAPIRRGDGTIAGCVLVFRDVTERRRASRVLAELDARRSAILRAAMDAVITIDAAGKVVDFNPAAERIFGYAREDVLGKELAQKIIPPGLREQHRAALARHLVTGEGAILNRRIEMPALRADGSEFRAELTVTRIAKEGPPEFTAFLRDVTERQRADETRARLAAIVESSDDAIVSKDLNGVIMSWNPGAERLFGYTAAETVGRPITMLIPGDAQEEEERILARLRRGERLEHYETVRRKKDGTLIDVSLTVSPIQDGGGRIVGASKIARDIGGRKRAEAALVEADRRKDEFLAMLAHELRNPLSSISNAVHVLRLSGGDGEASKTVSQILDRQVRQMARFVDDLLDVSRITRGRIELKKQLVDLAPLLAQTAEAVRPLAESMGHRLTVRLPAERIRLDADPVRLSQIVSNLLNNACKFTERGGRVELSAEREGAEAVLRVRDSGIGIAAEHLPHIFGMFMQVDTSLERSVGGLGIGLTLVQSLVRMHGGSVEARSEGLGRGSEFVVRLPIAADAPDPASPAQIDGSATAAAGRRILIVDDNADAARSLAVMLGLDGHRTETVHDGLEAIERGEGFRPEVVLLDIGLPRLNGYEVARRIRGEAWGKGVVLIAVTGWGEAEARQRSRDAGFDAHVVKPVDHAALGKLLATLAPGGA